MTETQIDGDDSFVFPIDIAELSKRHVGFLQSLHQLGVTIQQPSAKSLQRYRDLWLPLVHGNPTEALIPPADCAWLWHCHRLAPFRYLSFLKLEFGNDCQILEANPAFCFQWTDDEVYGKGLDKTDDEMYASAEQTRLLWNQKYPEESFHLQPIEPSCQHSLPNAEEKVDNDFLLLNGFDLLGSTDRQATFLWQVSGPRFANDDFLKEGAMQYYKFVKLRKEAKKADIVLVPTYQIDLMWHTHILSSLSGYFSDCKAIMGSTLNHDDSLNDRSDDGPLDRAFKDTKALWKENYEEEYFANGGMYRGEPPQEYYSTSWSSRISNEEAQIPLGPFLHMINVQGASSTNPTGGAYDLEIVWAWKESPSEMSKHPAGSIVGDPSECWIKYNNSSNAMLEAAFEGQGGEGTCDLGNGYVVDFLENKQTETSTGYVREVQRIVKVKSALESAKVWCWKETSGQMGKHNPSVIHGNPSDCWIKYDDTANAILESAYQAQGAYGKSSPCEGYVVNFSTMKQTKTATGFEREVQRVDANDESANHTGTVYWTPITGTAPDGSPAFVPMAPKSRTRGVNANPFKQDYIFGKSGTQTGYFHTTTKESYEILTKRIEARVRAKKHEIAMDSCCGLSYVHPRWEADLEKLETALAITKARAGATNPSGKVGLPPKDKKNYRNTDTYYYDDTGVWYFPPDYYDCGGGCGGGAAACSGGGGCGAAACGTAACGGGGYSGGGDAGGWDDGGGGGCGGGGGGCGGGGCGGGGCGG